MPHPPGPSGDSGDKGNWARFAGVGLAILARQGARVLLDRSRYGTDTLSTHALMRGAVIQLHR